MSIDVPEKSKLKPYLVKAMIAIAIIIVLLVYFKIFLIKGIIYDDVFLKRSEVSASEINYSGIGTYGDMTITVKNAKEMGVIFVEYNLPNNIHQQFTVESRESADQYSDKYLIIKKDEVVVFKGNYNKKNIFLIDSNGDVFFGEDEVSHYRNSRNPYYSGYKVALKNVADLAFFSNDIVLGRIELLVFAVFLFGLTLFDRKFPLFFFTMKHLLDVRDPEPSDFYIYIQKLTWIVYPIVGVCFMLYAIISRFV